jgi:hypothetical protein
MTRHAVLMVIFNRPEQTMQTFAPIRRARPPRLYLAADGPRPGRPDDGPRCAAARTAVLEAIDWPCELQLLLRDENLGCRRAVSSAIDWFFAQEEAGIIVEDDCLLADDFFPYADELLERYRDDQRIGTVSAMAIDDLAPRDGAGYRFTRHHQLWGWASWRRAWQYYDVDMAGWPQLRDGAWLAAAGDGSRRYARYWQTRFDACVRGAIDTWDYQWLYACLTQQMLGIVPAVNLVSNIGYGPDATHTLHAGDGLAARPHGTLAFPLHHPTTLVRDVAADRRADTTIHAVDNPLWRRIRRRLRRLSMRQPPCS